MSGSEQKSRTARAEALGLALIALAILMIVLARWGGYLSWSLR